MDGSIQSVLLFGFGNGTVDGSNGLVITLGFGVSSQISSVTYHSLEYRSERAVTDYACQVRSLADYQAPRG